MAEIPVKFLVEKLGTLLLKEVQLLGNMGEEVKEIREELEIIQAFLKDADRRKDRSQGIKIWVKQVRRIAYELEDVIDEFVIQFGTRNEGGGIMNFFGTLLCALKQLPPSYDLSNRIQGVKRRIAKISERRDKYDIKMTDEDQSSDGTMRPWQDYGDANLYEEAEVVGIKEKVKDLVKQLREVTGNGQKTFISVVGMGGLGKSTLARRVYNESKVKGHFDCFAWVTVSQSFNIKDLLNFVLREFGKALDIEKMGSVNLIKSELQKHLEGKRFILVLDDVWDKSVCADINSALLENFNGSKIMITTRIESVAIELEAIGNINHIRHVLKPLDDDAALELLSQKAFSESKMPPEFENEGKIMLQKCGGLPLAIVTLGGILRTKKNLSEWEKVGKEPLGNYDSTSMDSTTSILKLSYDELPLHLKPCFLYCGLFPEDHLMEADQLIRLWVAEGFIKERGGVTMEDVGEDYLMQLIDRSMLQRADVSIDGRVESCRMHDLMHDLAISISQEDEFFFKVKPDKQVTEEDAIKARLMSVSSNSKISSTAGVHHLRSFFYFAQEDMFKDGLPSYLGKFTFLRVLNLQSVSSLLEWKVEIKRERPKKLELPKEIGQLLHLRYLNLRGVYSLKRLSKSIGRLQNLETLDIKNTGIRKLPNEIVGLKNLRHLCMGQWGPAVEVPRGIGDLRWLQTLTGVDGSSEGIAADIAKLKELRTLDIRRVKEEDAEKVYAAISGLNHLLRHLSEWPVNSTLGTFKYLSSLVIQFGSVREDPFPSLSSLPSLLQLRLAYLDNVKRLQCDRGTFPKLRSLELFFMEGLEAVTVEEGSMASLMWLTIEGCGKLEMVPQAIQHLKPLQELLLEPIQELLLRLMMEGGEDPSTVQHISLVWEYVHTNRF